MALLGARLHEAGFSIGHLDGVFVTHLYEPTLRGTKAITLDFVYGECLMRTHDDAAHFDGYFGYAAEWGDRRRFEPAAARSVVASIARSMLERKARGRGLLRELVSWLPAALAGDAPFLLAAATRERANALAVKLPIGKGRSYRAFVRWHAAVVNGGRLRWQHTRASSLPAIDPADGEWTAEELGADTLVGVYGHERGDGVTFRWLRPASLVRVAPSGPGGTVTLDTLGLRGDPLGYVQAVFAGGMRVPRDAVSGDSRFLRIALDEKLAAAAQRGGLTLLCAPLVPARAGQGDDRRLGIPVAAIAVEAAVRPEARACG
jgi:hypothetical protein